MKINIQISPLNKKPLLTMPIPSPIIEKAYANILRPVFQAIEKNSQIYYDLPLEEDIYFIEYLNTINKVFIGFNSFLLTVVYEYCILKNINYYEGSISKSFANWFKCTFFNKPPQEKSLDALFHPNGNKNSVEDLFKFLVKEKICFENQFFPYFLYEDIFRNQICHGWYNFFYSLLQQPLSAKPNWNQITGGKKKNFLFSNKIDRYSLRVKIKSQTIINKPSNFNLSDYLGSPNLFHSLLTNLQEPIFKISLPYDINMIKNIEKAEPGSTKLNITDMHGNIIYDNHGDDYSYDLLKAAQKNKNLNLQIDINLSLNNLIDQIGITIDDLIKNFK